MFFSSSKDLLGTESFLYEFLCLLQVCKISFPIADMTTSIDEILIDTGKYHIKHNIYTLWMYIGCFRLLPYYIYILSNVNPSCASGMIIQEIGNSDEPGLRQMEIRL